VVLAAEGKAFCAGPAGDAGATLAGLDPSALQACMHRKHIRFP
jgi:hypothetical protein